VVPAVAGAVMAIRAHFATLPTGNTNAVVPILFIGPSTKLVAEPEVAVEPAFIVKILVASVFKIPLVKVSTFETIVGLLRVILLLPEVPVLKSGAVASANGLV